MSNLILDNFDIRNFRGFNHLQIDRLGRVNLIVGKNNVGKTSLLEAVRLYVRGGSPRLIWTILRTRNEISGTLDRTAGSIRGSSRILDSDERGRISIDTTEQMRLACEQLFYGRGKSSTMILPIRIGPISSSESTLKIALERYIEQQSAEGVRQLQVVEQPSAENVADLNVGLTIQIGEQPKIVLPTDESEPLFRRWATSDPFLLKELRVIIVPSNGLQEPQMGSLWDSVALTELEEDVLSGLRIISSDIERISLISSSEMRSDRIVVAKVSGLPRPIPLKSLGDGMNRILGINLALVNARNGVVLIDEIENGIHYSVQLDMWRLIFQLARKLNVQIFATSHSWDCIESFQKASQENQEEEGMLVRLDSKKGDVRATLFDERRLAVATRDHIEVR